MDRRRRRRQARVPPMPAARLNRATGPTRCRCEIVGDGRMRGIPPLVGIVVLVVVGLLVIGVIVVARRIDFSGYRVGRDVVVRCRDGHLFTTTWIPLMSIKAIRLGWFRFQYCPVGNHLTLVVLVRDSDLTNEERRIAARYHDGGIP